ncbi:MAG: hypothetical protein Q9227_006912 [Pyrenula ochraceoflavens]
MPSKSKKQGTGPANVSRPQPTIKPSSRNLDTAPASELSNPKNTISSAQNTERQISAGDTTEEDGQEPGNHMINKAGDSGPAPTVNRKKQKRRAKEAAKRAEQEQLKEAYNAAQVSNHNGQDGNVAYPSLGRGPPKGYFIEEPEFIDQDYADDSVDADYYSGGEEPFYDQDDYVQNGYPAQVLDTTTGKSKKKKKNKKGNIPQDQSQFNVGASSSSRSTPLAGSRPPPTTLSNAALRAGHKMSRDQIWNTSTQAERENIKQFWLGLGEDDRRSLVKVEKEAVLQKMKEQQKHSCSCTVCGRKRTAIEEELEALYDSYYVELEQYANHNQGALPHPHMMSAVGPSYRVNGADRYANAQTASRGRIEELEDDELEDEYDEDDEEDYSDADLEEEVVAPGAAGFFTFGNSLTVKDGILTVADDLLKNDGKKFIDMIEQLAERRVDRQKDLQYTSASLAHQGLHQGHNHPPFDEEDDYDDDDDDDDYDSQEDDEYEGDEMDSMTERDRMEEGRRMFQIFAARMFEQRVLSAYRNKVSQERQRKLIEELDEEDRLGAQREAKKAREAAKKKEKKKAQKAAKEEERARKEAEKAAQEEAARAIEQRKQEEQKQRREEQRKKREAERRAQEEERARKEAEKQRKINEERERQAEAERKQREAKEREKRKKEEARKKAREEREAKEREAREMKEKRQKDERERKAKEDQARKEKEAAARTENLARETARKEEQARQAAVQPPPKRPMVAVPPGLHAPTGHSNLQSPHFPIATPVIPKAPTPNRPRQTSQQGSQQGQQSHGSSPKSQQAVTDNSVSSNSPASNLPQTPGGNLPFKAQTQGPVLHHPQPTAPLSPLNAPGRTNQAPYGNFAGMPGLGMNGVPTSGPNMPGMMHHMPMYQGPPMTSQHRNFGHPNTGPFPPGINGARPYHLNQPFHSQAPMPPPTSIPHQPMKDSMRSQPHSRHPSGSVSYDQVPPGQDVQPAPIGRPAPIARPSSTTPDKQNVSKERFHSDSPGIDDLTAQLGSKALLDDSDAPMSTNAGHLHSAAPGAPNTNSRAPFSPFVEHDTFRMPLPSQNNSNTWSSFASPGLGGPGPWGPSTNPSGTWPTSINTSGNTLGSIGGSPYGPSHRSNAPRPVKIRLMVIQACQNLSNSTDRPSGTDSGFHLAQDILLQVEMMKPPNEQSISLKEVLEICETEGDGQNGGGSFKRQELKDRGTLIKFDQGYQGPFRGAGDIGSPIVGHREGGFSGIGGAFGGPRGF